jgi:hypothetical protein
MTLTKKQPCPKKEYQKIGFDLKLSIIDQITNGQISVNYAACMEFLALQLPIG